MSLLNEEPVVYVKHTIDVLNDQGVDTKGLLKTCGISEQALADKSAHISRSQYAEFLDYIVHQISIPGLGLLDGQDMNLLDHGILGYAMYASANVGEAIARHTMYQDILGAVLKTELVIDDDLAHIRVTEIARPDLADTEEKLRYQTEQLFCLWNQHGPAFGQSKLWLSRVDFCYKKPAHSAMYEDFFKCPVHFDQPYQQISFGVDILHQPLSFANEDAASLCDKQCLALLDELKEKAGLTGDIRRLLGKTPGEYPNLETAARALAISSRTLRRKLSQEGITYKQIILDFRMEIAAACLSKRSMPIAEVAYTCGYTEYTNFYRAFSQYFGQAPKGYRDQHCSTEY